MSCAAKDVVTCTCGFVLADLWREGAATRYPVLIEHRTGRIVVRCPKCGERNRMSVKQIARACAGVLS